MHLNLDYVIAHEPAHGKVSGHREGFWRLLRTAQPEYEARRAYPDELAALDGRGPVGRTELPCAKGVQSR
ncbi:YgjP-like metallopeptidase domain-containing protein [Streptomyces tibetensis]|uniref:YgjP-like metallopeptidase domain-containing protein n=1 Tax=Streptomyces tibetensis TaxID=2382123 RepID=UPI0033DC8CD8